MTVSSYMTQSVAVAVAEAGVEAAVAGTARVSTLLVCHLSVGQFIMTSKWQAMMCYPCVRVECVFLLLFINKCTTKIETGLLTFNFGQGQHGDGLQGWHRPGNQME